MIQIYSQKNTNYTVNGDAVLTPSLCEINTDGWQLALEHPLDEEGRWRLIAEGAVLKVPSFLPDGQLFRIFNVLKSDDGVTATAQPIFFDSKDDCLLIDVRPTGKTGQQALDILTAGTKYSGSSDIPGTSTAYYQLKNLMEALTGEDENSFINRWGGEVLYNNYEIVINNRLGADNGVGLLYGKNIPENGMSVETDLSGVVTRIYPKAYNGRMMSGTLYVDSPNINAYPTVKQKVMEFADVRLAEDISGTEDTEGLVVCADQTALNAALRQKCQEQFSAGIDAPAVTIACDMMLLADTANYADLKDLETVSLGDTVHCKNNQLGITTTARVTSLVYDCIRKGVKSVVIGSEPYNYIADTSSTIQAADAVIDKGNNTLLADRIAGIINLMHTSLRAQKDIAEKQDVRAILFEDLDENSPTFGALCIGTQGIQISKQRTPEGTDWVWTTAINFQAVNASAILTGELWANLIKTGRIESQDGSTYFDLDTAELVASKGNIIGGLIKTGRIESKDGTVYFDLDEGKLVASEIIGKGDEPGQLIIEDNDGAAFGEVLTYKKGNSILLQLFEAFNTVITLAFNGSEFPQIQAWKNGNQISMSVQNGGIVLSNGRVEIYATLANSSSGGCRLIINGNENQFQFLINGAVVAYIDSSGFHNA